jgi:cytochrome c-type biogenesis protein CcmI
MGLVSRLLTLPLEPVRGAAWVAETLRDAAEDEYYDESRIRRQLLELENDLSAGRISEQEYEAAEDELVDRLLEAQQRGAAPRPGTP